MANQKFKKIKYISIILMSEKFIVRTKIYADDYKHSGVYFNEKRVNSYSKAVDS
jgi:hypothetical protein